MVKTINSDVLVVGGGMAAAMAAVWAAGSGAKTTLVDRGTFMASGSSPVSLGGFGTSTSPDDSPDILFNDLLRVGYGLNEQNLIWEAAWGAAENQRFIESISMKFVKQTDGNYWYYKGVGHSVHRGLTVDHNLMGLNVVAVVGLEAWRRGVRLLDNVRITKILGKENGVAGAVGVSGNGTFYLFDAKAVVLAAGGANNLYPNACEDIRDEKYKTTGDAFALAFDKGVPLIDLEFPNFREGCAYGTSRMGGFIVNARGEKIMQKYDPVFLENASRGKKVEAIYTEIHEGRGPIYWQIPEKIPEFEKAHGWADLEGKKIPVEIDYQRLLGGANINEKAETSIKGLYAARESAGGFHGADRMMSASFLECTIFGSRAGRSAAKYALAADVELDLKQANEEVSRLREIQERKTGPDPSDVFEKVQKTMWIYCSVVKQADEMKKGLELIRGLREEKPSGNKLFAALDATNLALTAEMVTRSSLRREETRGTHIRKDFPMKDDAKWLKHIAIQNSNGRIITKIIPVTEISR